MCRAEEIDRTNRKNGIKAQCQRQRAEMKNPHKRPPFQDFDKKRIETDLGLDKNSHFVYNKAVSRLSAAIQKLFGGIDNV